MKRKNILRSCSALGIGILLGMQNQVEARATIDPGESLADNVEVDVSGNSVHGMNGGIASDQNIVTSVGDSLKITTDGTYSYGAILRGTQNEISIGNNLEVTTKRAESDAIRMEASNSKITIGDGAMLTTLGNDSNGVMVGETTNIHDSEVIIGNDMTISTQGYQSSGVTINMFNYNNRVTIGDRLKISTSGENGYGLASNGGRGTVPGGIGNNHISVGDNLEITTTGIYGVGTIVDGISNSITVGKNAVITTGGLTAHGIRTAGTSNKTTFGDNLKVTTTGQKAHGIFQSGADAETLLKGKVVIETTNSGSMGVYNSQSGNVTFQGVTGITTKGTGSHGVDVKATAGKEAKVIFTEQANIRAEGSQSHGVYAETVGATVDFQKGTTIEALDSVNGYALLARNGGIIQGAENKHIINGDLGADTNGQVNFTLGRDSVFTGSAYQNNGAINLVMKDNSIWNMTNQWAANLTMDNGGHLYFHDNDPDSFMHVNGYGTVTINGGTIHFDTDIVNEESDYFVVKDGIKGSGGFITVNNSGSAETTGTETVGLIDDEVPEATPATFSLTNVVELGGYNYVLDQRDDGNGGIEWYLKAVKSLVPDNPNPPVITDPGSAGVNIFSGAYLLNYAETQTLLKRLGDLRGGTQDNGVWARVYGGKFQSSGDAFLRGFDMDYWGMQTGYDKKIEREDKKGTVYVGGFFGYSKGDLDYLNNGSGSIDSKSIGAYWTHIHRNGFYADAVLKYNWMKNDFKQLDSAGSWVKGSDISTQGFTGSLEVGRRYFLKTKENGEKIRVEDRQGWYVEPQFQLTLGHQSGGKFTASNGLRIKADAYRSVMARVETHLGYEVKNGKNPVNVYAKLGVVKEFDGEVDYTLNGSRESTSYGDTWKLWGLGITAKFSKKHDVYFEVERATGGQFTQSWAINGGYRFSW